MLHGAFRQRRNGGEKNTGMSCPAGYVGVSKNSGISPKMDGLFHGKPYEQMDDLGVLLFLETSV